MVGVTVHEGLIARAAANHARQAAHLDHRRAPVVAALRRYQAADTVNFATPGHKLGQGVDPDLRSLLGHEVFASDVWLNPGILEETLREAQALAAAAWGADHAWFLVNGSSCGNHGFLLGMLRPGDTVVVARDIHKSLLVALILTGAHPVYVTPRLHPDLDLSLGVAPTDIAETLDAHPAARLVVISSPSYWGIATDVPGVVAAAHARGVPVYVDEAWGPHFPFHPSLPPAAMACGADAAITSPHKLLASLNQGSLLQLGSPRLDADRIAVAVRMVQSTSPFLPFLASLDACRRQMALHGEPLLERALTLAMGARRRLQKLPGLTVLDPTDLHAAAGCDPTKIVIDVRGLGMTGFAVEQALRERFAVAPAMSDLDGVVCFVTVGDTDESLDRLVHAFAALSAERQPRIGLADRCPRSMMAAVAPAHQALTPREAFFAPARGVPLGEAAGEVATELVIPYPPGIPVLAPGEIVTADKVAYLQAGAAAGMCFRGPADPTLATIRVVADVPAHVAVRLHPRKPLWGQVGSLPGE